MPHTATPNVTNQRPESEEEGEGEEDTLLFSCRCESAKAISTLLSSLRHIGKGSSTGIDNSDRNTWRGSKAQLCTVYVTENALTFHVHGVARQSQTTADLQAGLFSDYFVCSEEILVEDESGGDPKKDNIAGGEFCVNLTTVLECIGVLGQSNLDRTRLCMSYDREVSHRYAILYIEVGLYILRDTNIFLGSLAYFAWS